jgi:hypothetical protein
MEVPSWIFWPGGGRFLQRRVRRKRAAEAPLRLGPGSILGQWARFVGKAPEVWLLNVFDLAPSGTDVLALTTRDPVGDGTYPVAGRVIGRGRTRRF